MFLFLYESVHPKERLPVKPTFKNNKITLNVTFHLVYPAPDCSAMIGVCILKSPNK